MHVSKRAREPLTSSTTEAPPACGDGKLDALEVCGDGNRARGCRAHDTCNWSEPGQVRNCGQFHVFYVKDVSWGCSGRYCGGP